METARGGNGSEREQPVELAEASGKDVGRSFETMGPQCVGGSISPATVDDWVLSKTKSEEFSRTGTA